MLQSRIHPAGAIVTTVLLIANLLIITSDAATARGPVPHPGLVVQSRGVSCTARPPLAERVEFASRDRAARILGRTDAWARQLSAFDRGARMRTLEPTTTREFLQHAAGAALSWAPWEEAYWMGLVHELSDAADGLNLAVPHVFMVKTDGLEEFNAAYTRNRSIILPQERVALAGQLGPGADFYLLAHELFHVLSTENPALRHTLYSLLGFERFRRFEYPIELEERRASNPQAHDYEHALTVQTASGPADVVPVLQVTTPLEEVIQLPTSGPPAIFAHIDVPLVPVDTGTGDVLRDSGNNLVTYGFGNTDWPARMLRNSSYIIHPEELLADNFALLMEWRRSGILPASMPGGPGTGFPVNDVGLLEAIEEILAAGCREG